MSRAVLDLFGSRGSGKRMSNSNRSTRKKPTSSDVAGVMKKLRRMSEFKNADDNRVRHEAEGLSDPVRIVERHFGPIAYNLLHEKLKELSEDPDKLTSTYEEKENTIKSKIRVEEVARFQVKLLLRYVDTRRIQPEMIGRLAAALHMEYGPLHTSLVINDTIQLQWDNSGLIIPKVVTPDTDVTKLAAATVQDLPSIQHQLSGSYQSSNEVEMVFDAASQKLELIERLAGVIAQYNNKYAYNLIFRNCQTFVIDALAALGCTEKPQFQGKMKEYFTHLKRKGKVLMEFGTHDELDVYIEKHHSHLTMDTMEYLLAQYFMFHTNNMLGRDMSQTWQCRQENCMVDFLEIKIGEKSLALHRFIRLKHKDQQRETLASIKQIL